MSNRSMRALGASPYGGGRRLLSVHGIYRKKTLHPHIKIMVQYSYLIRRKVFTLLGAAFHIYDFEGNLIAYSRQKAFKLKEDIRIYADESKQTEILMIKARRIMDFSAAYDVIDPTSGEVIGTWQRKGWSSLVRDNWELHAVDGTTLASVKEDSMALALIRRFLTNIIPQDYHLAPADGIGFAKYTQNFNPFVFKLKVSLSPDLAIDSRLVLAGGILLTAIEGRQE